MVRSVSNMWSTRGSLMSPILAGFLVMCCVLVSSANRNVEPGFKVRISQKGLDNVRDVGIQMLQEQKHLLVIPDKYDIIYKYLSEFHYDVTRMSITKLFIPTVSLSTNPAAGGMTLKTSGISLKVHGQYRYNICGLSFCTLLPLWDSGEFDASASSISVSVMLKIGVDTTGRPTISSRASNCYINIGGIDVDLRGGFASWIYYYTYLIKSTIEGSIKDALNEQICGEVIDQVNRKLKNLQVIAPVPAPVDVIEFDYSLVESPSFDGYVSTAHKGRVYPIGSKTECPLPVSQIPPDSDTSRMAFIWISEYLPNSAGYVLQNIGFLQYNVTPDNVPAEAKDLLNTSNFAFAFDLIMPQINKMYPNMAMQINIKSTKAPVIKIASTGVQADLVGDFTTYAILPNKTLAYLLTLSMSISAKVSMNFTGNNITGNIASCSATLEAVRSAEEPFFTSSLQFAVSDTFYLNQLGAVGIPIHQLINLPDGLKFTNPVIYLGEGFLKIGTDATYKP